MTKYEYIKQELEFLNDYNLKELYNEFASANSWEMVYDNTQDNVIEFCNNDLSKYLSMISSDYHRGDNYFTIDGYGHFKSFDYLIEELDYEAVIEWIDSNDLYDRYEDMFDYYEGCEEEEDE